MSKRTVAWAVSEEPDKFRLYVPQALLSLIMMVYISLIREAGA